MMLCTYASQSQSIVGLWEIKKVNVEDQVMTPKGKWIKIEQDLVYHSGNGWTKNTEGIIDIEPDSSILKPISSKGVADPFGHFNYEVQDSTMFWTREEEGAVVEVYLEKIERLPIIDTDKILGAWQLTDVQQEIVLFFRPDGRYLEFKDKARSSGYYYVHPHRSIVTLISDDRLENEQRFQLTFDAENLKLKPIGEESTRTLVFKPTRALPE